MPSIIVMNKFAKQFQFDQNTFNTIFSEIICNIGSFFKHSNENYVSYIVHPNIAGGAAASGEEFLWKHMRGMQFQHIVHANNKENINAASRYMGNYNDHWIILSKLRWNSLPNIFTMGIQNNHDNVIKWKHFPHYWSPVNSPQKGQ